MPSCAVATCSNTHRNKDKDVLFHRFPQDLKLQKEWVQKCRRKDLINPKNAVICSEHFVETDYIDDMQNRLLGLPIKRRLKNSSIPSTNLPCSKHEQEITPRSERQKKRKNIKYAFDSLDSLDRLNDFNYEGNCSKDINDAEITQVNKNADREHCEKCDMLQKEVQNLNFELKCARNELSILKKEKRRAFKTMARKLKRIQLFKSDRIAEFKQMKRKTNALNEENAKLKKLKENIKGVFSETQINAILGNKKTNWTPDDISKCIVLRALSSKAYDFWRDKIGVPLPSVSTLKRWCAKFEVTPGILHDVLLLMKKNSENLTQAEKLCVLSFDEMHIDSRLCYDSKLDQILGPSKKVQFALARGLITPWKQPVYFDFDKQMNKSLLSSVIKNVEESGAKVVSIVSDLGGSQTLWKELEITETNTCFSSPSNPPETIWVFADMPHYLKLLRNHFLDKGFLLGDGTIITSDIIKEVLEKDNGEVRLCYKLKDTMLTVKGNERQKVAPAKILFSATTATAIKHFTGNVRASDFFHLIDQFFDIMNSKCPQPPSNKPMKAAFGLENFYEDQKAVLEAVKKEISEMRVIGKKSLMPFQKAILVSINSLLGLHEMLKSFEMKYILTTRLTQDALESLFSQIRGLGRFNDHPSPSEVIVRLKRLLLANKLPALSSKINHADSPEKADAYLTSTMIETAFAFDSPVSDPDAEQTFDGQNEDFINFEDFFDNSSNACEIETETETVLSESEEEALAYVAGVIACRERIKNNDSSLGNLTKNLDSVPPYAAWIFKISAGGLTVPSPTWMETVKKMDAVFRKIHGENFYKGRGVIKNMISELEIQFPFVQKSANKLFARIRTFIRIRHLNRQTALVSYRKAQQKKQKWIK